jgi:hypothetical protein
MTGRVQGKVAFNTGAARGQERSHAIRPAQEGADIIAVDLCESIPSVDRFYPGATEADLADTVAAVEALDRRIIATKADVRDYLRGGHPAPDRAGDGRVHRPDQLDGRAEGHAERRGLHREQACRAVGRAGRRQQRGTVPGFRRSALRHLYRAEDRRGLHPPVSRSDAPYQLSSVASRSRCTVASPSSASSARARRK